MLISLQKLSKCGWENLIRFYEMDLQLRQKVSSPQETELPAVGWRAQPSLGTGNMIANWRPQVAVKDKVSEIRV